MGVNTHTTPKEEPIKEEVKKRTLWQKFLGFILIRNKK